MNANYTIKVPVCVDVIFSWPVLLYRRIRFGYSYRRIYLGEGEWTILDLKDYYRLAHFNWRLRGKIDKLYAVRDSKGKEQINMISMHREITNAPKGMLVDHKNDNSLDNRSENLRLATHSQNMINKPKRKSPTSSKFIGVCLYKRSGKWSARINKDKKRIWLGAFENETDAAKAYDAAAKKYHGQFARLNFPEAEDSV